MAWMYLIVAGLFEVGWAIGLKYTQGFSKFWPSVFTITAIVISMSLLATAVKTIPVGTGYAVWTGIGALGTAILGIVLFAEPVTVWRILFLLMLLVGILGLKATASKPEPPALNDSASTILDNALPPSVVKSNPTS
jgi:quaternary ammonium compound-resistance protein SugE